MKTVIALLILLCSAQDQLLIVERSGQMENLHNQLIRAAKEL